MSFTTLWGTTLMLKQIVHTVVHTMGFELVRRGKPKPDLSAYQRLDAHTLARKPFYNVGAGSFRHPYWTNVDKPSDWYRDQQQPDMIAFDLLKNAPLPIA